MNIYIGGLARETTEDELKAAFEAFGKVDTVSILKDKFTGEPRGFGFIEMPAKAEAEAAIAGMNGKELKGKALRVNEAKPKEEGRRGGGNRSGGGRSW